MVGPLAAVRRLARRRVCGHSVMAVRIVVPSSLARLMLIASGGYGDLGDEAGVGAAHGARIAPLLFVLAARHDATGMQLSLGGWSVEFACHSWLVTADTCGRGDG